MKAEDWISVKDRLPEDFGDILLYREDAGVFSGFYGNAAECLSDNHYRHLVSEGLTEDEGFKVDFFGYDFDSGIFRLDGKEAPEYWMPLPKPPISNLE